MAGMNTRLQGSSVEVLLWECQLATAWSTGYQQPPKIDFPVDLHTPAETSDVSNPFQGEKILTKHSLFDSNKLEILKKKKMAMEDGAIKSCSNFTVLTAFAWRARSKARRMNPDQTSPLLFAADVRSKLHPPLVF
uniref:Uncharacterized protein n=1 Tax=Salix viminalis TaxID=40686 RepID=A0A6N2MF66_SALVM